MVSEHIVKAYDEELGHLNNAVIEMGGHAESQIASAIQAVVKRDVELAGRVIEADAKVDSLEHEVETFSVRLLALRQPMAADLRNIIAALKISANLERIADYASNVAKRAIALSQSPEIKAVPAIARMGRLTQQMVKNILDAYTERDADKAVAVWQSDEEVDEMYNSIFRELLTYMMEDPRNITPCTHLLFIAKNIERIGDHTTNVAEHLYYFVHGRPLHEDRPKGDTTSLTVMDQPKGASRSRKS